jgi:hypothetical protein
VPVDQYGIQSTHFSRPKMVNLHTWMIEKCPAAPPPTGNSRDGSNR